MNREIKFRGQQINTKKWVYGYLYRNKGLYVICENIRYAEEEPILLDTVGQYTGLHDKNGKEIYEGDIVKIKYRDEDIGKVIYEHNGFSIDVTNMNKNYGRVSFVNNFIEVIGNIYDNPELLGGKDKR